MATSSPLSARQRLTNFSRRFSRRDENSYFPPPPEAQGAPNANGGVLQQHDTDKPKQNRASAMSGSTATYNTLTPPGVATTSSSEEPPSDPSSSSSPLSGEYQIRPPLTHRRFSSLHASSKNFQLPDLPWLCGTWHVTHSTLPMWKNKRNVRIMYTRLPGNKLDDLVTYQNIDSKEIQSVHGIDTPKKDGSYMWRGKGFLKVATSRWEVLGWSGGGRHIEAGVPGADVQRKAGAGIVDINDANNFQNSNATGISNGLDPSNTGNDETEQWVVTYFAKTPFTPAGIDIYSRKSTGLSEATMKKLMHALTRLDGRKHAQSSPLNDLGEMVDAIFPVTTDNARADLKE